MRPCLRPHCGSLASLVVALILAVPLSTDRAEAQPGSRRPPPVIQRCVDRVGVDAAERARPTITLADMQLAMNRGSVSGMAASCLMDWHGANFAPLMSYFRARRIGERQLTYLACIHDEASRDVSEMNNLFSAYRAHVRCDGDLARRLPFTPPRARPR